MTLNETVNQNLYIYIIDISKKFYSCLSVSIDVMTLNETTHKALIEI